MQKPSPGEVTCIDLVEVAMMGIPFVFSVLCLAGLVVPRRSPQETDPMLEMDGPSPANLVIFQVIGREVKPFALTSSDPSPSRPASGWTCSGKCDRLFVGVGGSVAGIWMVGHEGPRVSGAAAAPSGSREGCLEAAALLPRTACPALRPLLQPTPTAQCVVIRRPSTASLPRQNLETQSKQAT